MALRVVKPVHIKIGSLGNQKFRKGFYCYVGSALNNLEKRVQRHVRTSLEKTQKKFWHIDYLLSSPFVKLSKVYYKESTEKEECRIASMISKSGGKIPGFGCSDCNCDSHLFKIKEFKLGLKELEV